MSPGERLQALIDRIYDPLAPTGLPKPRSMFKDGQGGQFNPRQWELAVDGNLLHKAYPTLDEFASLAESTRHEMEHALQWFRIARRENRIGGRSEPLSALADRLGIPLERAKAAQQANLRTLPAEDISPGSAADIQAQTHFQSVFDPIAGAQRNVVLSQLRPTVDALIRAEANLKWARANAGPKSPMMAAAQSEFARALQVHQQIYAAYRALPEEIAAWKAGEELKQAVLERETAKSLEQARLDLATAYDSFAPHEALNEVAKASDGALTREEQRAFDKTFGTWVTTIHRVQSLEAKLAALTKVGP